MTKEEFRNSVLENQAKRKEAAKQLPFVAVCLGPALQVSPQVQSIQIGGREMREYTPEQIQIQAKCFQLLKHNVDQYFIGQNLLPDFLKEEDTDSGIGAVTRWILEENEAEAFGEEVKL